MSVLIAVLMCGVEMNHLYAHDGEILIPYQRNRLPTGEVNAM